MEILLATANTHKYSEFVELFPEHRILLPDDIGINSQVEETGTSFAENALLKAQTLFQRSQRICLADDSGLCVDALHGAPGIYSARYGSELANPPLSDRDRLELLLERMHPHSNRTARFVCALVIYLGTERYMMVQETVEGQITRTPSGKNGFGYDPIFIPEQYSQTMAELGPEIKGKISHRGRAAARLGLLLKEPG